MEFKQHTRRFKKQKNKVFFVQDPPILIGEQHIPLFDLDGRTLQKHIFVCITSFLLENLFSNLTGQRAWEIDQSALAAGPTHQSLTASLPRRREVDGRGSTRRRAGTVSYGSVRRWQGRPVVGA